MFVLLLHLLALQDARPAVQDEPQLTEEFRLEVEGAEPIRGLLRRRSKQLAEEPDDVATVILVPGAGDLHVALDALVNPLHTRLMHVVQVDATRESLAPVLAWMAERDLDLSRVALVGFGEGCDAVIATRAAAPDLVRAAMLFSPRATALRAEEWIETPLYLYDTQRYRIVLEDLIETLMPHHRLATRFAEGDLRSSAFLEEHGHPALIANWLRDLLVSGAPVVVPCYAADDERTKQPGFFASTRRVWREREGVRYQLMTFAIGELWTLGAMIQGDFAGEIELEVDGHVHGVALDTGELPTEPLPVLRNGEASQLTAQALSFRGWTWVTLEFKKPYPNTRFELRFLPSEQRAITLPGDGAQFWVQLVNR
ncbi:MAG: hypothetical protein O2816_01650 [Planctomycetota bacterium]|nr:hypothetical protein [Planctomycetota bacterium]